jgi:hypothetical protein
MSDIKLPNSPANHIGEEKIYFPEFLLELKAAAFHQPNVCEQGLGELIVLLSESEFREYPENLLRAAIPAVAAVAAVPADGDNPAIPAIAAAPAQPAQYHHYPSPSDNMPRAANNLKDGALENHRRDVENDRKVRAARSKWMLLLIEAAGPRLMRQFRHPITGTTHLTPPILLGLLVAQLGTPTATEFDKLTEALDVPMGERNLGIILADHTDIHEKLLQYGQPISEQGKFKAFKKATAGHPGISVAIRDFEREHPRLAEQLFPELKLYVERQEPNFGSSAAAHGFGHSNAALASKGALLPGPSPDNVTLQQLLKRFNDLDAKFSAQHPTSKGKQSSAARANHNTRRAAYNSELYCWLHGQGHSGVQCRTMAADKASYNAAHIAASAPGQGPPGGSN